MLVYIKKILLCLFVLCVSNIDANSTQAPHAPVSGVSPGGPGFLLVHHSQTIMVPECPSGYTKLWDGFSLLSTESSGVVHNQDLGAAGSCVRKFSTLPHLSCDLNDVCYYAARDERSYWLSTSMPSRMVPASGTEIPQYLSRCVVCEAPANTIAVHSQSLEVPFCPQAWDTLWIGYSFVMHSSGGGEGGQSLASPGSCLVEFRAQPIIECSGRGGSCQHFADILSYWLKAIDTSSQFSKPQEETIISGYIHERISRCAVCIKRI